MLEVKLDDAGNHSYPPRFCQCSSAKVEKICKKIWKELQKLSTYFHSFFSNFLSIFLLSNSFHIFHAFSSTFVDEHNIQKLAKRWIYLTPYVLVWQHFPKSGKFQAARIFSHSLGLVVYKKCNQIAKINRLAIAHSNFMFIY